jgi:hypothetical protein
MTRLASTGSRFIPAILVSSEGCSQASDLIIRSNKNSVRSHISSNRCGANKEQKSRGVELFSSIASI